MGLGQALRDALAAPPPPLLTDEEHGEISGWFLIRHREWINRRVERIELVDDETIRRQVSVDFTLPASLADEGTTVYVPLAILRKEPLTNFDVWQEDRASNAASAITWKWSRRRSSTFSTRSSSGPVRSASGN